MMTLIQLCIEFFKTGLFAVGGGLATLPFLYEMSEKTGWFTEQDILNLIAISESTPGAIGINMATYAGYMTEGVIGGIMATLALVCPSIIVIILISKVLDRFKDSPVVQGIFKGLRPASTGLIAAAGLGVAKLALLNLDVYEATGNLTDILDLPSIAYAVIIFVCMRKFKLHTLLCIGISAVVGIAVGF